MGCSVIKLEGTARCFASNISPPSSGSNCTAGTKAAEISISLELFSDPEDGGVMLLRNVAFPPNYRALQPIRFPASRYILALSIALGSYIGLQTDSKVS